MHMLSEDRLGAAAIVRAVGGDNADEPTLFALVELPTPATKASRVAARLVDARGRDALR